MMNYRLVAVIVVGIFTLLAVTPAPSQAARLFVSSATVNLNASTVTLPLYRGTSKGSTVYFIVLDASDGKTASLLGVNRADKLNNAANTKAVQQVRIINGQIDFPASVNFSPSRVVIPTPGTGFPPQAGTQPGSEGEAGYSPLIQLPNNTVLNAPIIAADSGKHDKIIHIDTVLRRVTLQLTDGFSNGKAVKYLSTDASNPVAAALEASTLAPALNESPTVGDDSGQSSRATLVAFINGQTGATNPQRQGLNSALLDGLSPLNVLAWLPNQGRYSPLWDVHLAKWTTTAISGNRVRLETDVGAIFNLGQRSPALVTNPDDTPFSAAGFVVNCPIIIQL